MSDRPSWTPEQQSVIDARDSEILVSAAAGSGKTAVLVERLYSRIMDAKHPVDIDRFVVVTFTKAAAAEMKDRLRKRLEDALLDDHLSNDDRARIRKQIRLVPSAHISTVHSFCNYIIGQYFHRAGIDPSSKQATEAELTLLKKEVVSQLLEHQYELLDAQGDSDQEEPVMTNIARLKAFNKNDSELENIIISVYEKSVSEPFPDMLFNSWEKLVTTPLDGDSPYLGEVVTQTLLQAESINAATGVLKQRFDKLADKDKKTLDEMIRVTGSVIELGENYKKGDITAVEAYEKIKTVYDDMELKGLPKSPGEKEDDEYRIEAIAAVKPLRAALEKNSKVYYSGTVKEYDNERIAMSQTVLELISLAKQFGAAFSEAKRDRGIVDFNDLEQYALSILFDRDEKGYPVRSDAAMELADYFEEIMIDEYQDSNRVQDTILWAIAKQDEPRADGAGEICDTDSDANPVMPWEATAKNRFMVGDIKQSIYRFRNACPELFEHKMNTYTKANDNSKNPDNSHIRIDLHRNFRSRKIIIDSTNKVFEKVMHADVGGVEYDDDARLVYGLNLNAAPNGENVASKVFIDDFLFQKGDVHPDTKKPISKDSAEAYHIAKRINELVNGEHPLIIQTGKDSFRPVKYSDIVILSRSVGPISYEYAEIFREAGIPFVTELKQGFFGAREVSLILEMLSVINNPLRDIPLASVALSPIAGLTEDELCRVKIALNEKNIHRNSLYTALSAYVDERNGIDTEETVHKKISFFLNYIKEKRQSVLYMSLTEVVEDIYQDTNIYNYFLSLEDGERRSANMDYLLLKVTEFEQGGHSGIDEFIRYMEQIAQNQIDEGEALTVGENEDVVRLMSVHKSKGLEFPVVFLTRGESSGRNDSKEDSRLLFDMELGFVSFAENYPLDGMYYKPLIWNIVRDKQNKAERGELFRLLYVAMTRARDQLIVVNRVSDKAEKELSDSYIDRLEMKSFISMMMPAVRDDDKQDCFVRGDYSLQGWETAAAAAKPVAGANQETAETGKGVASAPEVKELLERIAAEADEEAVYIPAKISVSELKKASMEEAEFETLMTPEADKSETDEPEAEETAPASSTNEFIRVREEDKYPMFMKEDKEISLTGAERGTVFHHVMATIDFEKAAESVEEAFEELIQKGHISEKELDIVPCEKVKAFFDSELGQRMVAAYKAGMLHREQPFIMNKAVDEIPAYAGSVPSKQASDDSGNIGDSIMVQGIIDAYFEEDGEIVLMDYKTDRISEKKLVNRYHVQTELYAEAITKATGMRVKESWLYSFHTDRPVEVGGVWS